eukprot:TRINITY_DN6435_c0_g1_i1.p1 TRINITY_DN6435_c0_g1~~TRINITY_DN6435_c0_g1_i1.p1  ORF type:complete len:487 (-),score=63.12 TRINITY_DN6435_c0_g1_i1:68-1528(-)
MMGPRDRIHKRNEEALYKSVWNHLITLQNQQPALSPSQRKRNFAKMGSGPVTSKLTTCSHDSWLMGVQLCLWDNICGPKIEHVWEGKEDVSEAMQLYIARHTLCGEIAQAEMQVFAPETKFHVFSDHGIVVTATLFMAPYYGHLTKFCLAIFSRKKNLRRYLIIHPFVEDAMFQLVCKLRALFGRIPLRAVKEFEVHLPKFVRYTEQLFTSYLQDSVDISKTILSRDLRSHNETLERDVDFLAKAITSHLQTHGSTIVTGNDKTKINMYIDCLSYFLLPKERLRSAHTSEKYVPDLILQGVLGGPSSITDEEVIQSLMPSTMIDVDEKTIKATYPYNVYTILRREYIMAQVQKIVTDIPSEKSTWLQEGLLSAVPEAAPCIRMILNELFSIPLFLREGYLYHSMRILTRKAVALIKYVEVKCEQDETAGMDEAGIRLMKADMDITSDSDLNVLLGIAEKLSTGIYYAVRGDPSSIEDRLRNMFEIF